MCNVETKALKAYFYQRFLLLTKPSQALLKSSFAISCQKS